VYKSVFENELRFVPILAIAGEIIVSQIQGRGGEPFWKLSALTTEPELLLERFAHDPKCRGELDCADSSICMVRLGNRKPKCRDIVFISQYDNVQQKSSLPAYYLHHPNYDQCTKEVDIYAVELNVNSSKHDTYLPVHILETAQRKALVSLAESMLIDFFDAEMNQQPRTGGIKVPPPLPPTNEVHLEFGLDSNKWFLTYASGTKEPSDVLLSTKNWKWEPEIQSWFVTDPTKIHVLEIYLKQL